MSRIAVDDLRLPLYHRKRMNLLMNDGGRMKVTTSTDP
jgi:hypothetical protein